MKTPTNFIPIIGPLYADDLQPTRYRAIAICVDTLTMLCLKKRISNRFSETPIHS
jgi:hypothetical protein